MKLPSGLRADKSGKRRLTRGSRRFCSWPEAPRARHRVDRCTSARVGTRRGAAILDEDPVLAMLAKELNIGYD